MDVQSALQRVLEGDTDAFGDVIVHYQASVWRIVASMLRDFHATEDLVQQVFVAAYRGLGNYRREDDFGKWLKGIARNLVRAELRRRGRERMRLRQHEDRLTSELSHGDRAEQKKERLEEIVAECIGETLSDSSRTVLSLRYGQGWDFAKIAVRMGRTAVAVRQVLVRAREALRECSERKMVKA